MAYSICPEHGAHPAELATADVSRIVRAKSTPEAHRIHPITLAYEQFEYAGFATDADLLRFEHMGAVFKESDVWEFQREDAMEEALGFFSAACSRCLSAIIDVQI